MTSAAQLLTSDTLSPARRAQPRVPVNLPVTIEHAAGPTHAVAVNLGLGGMFVEAPSSLSYGLQVDVLVQVSPRSGPLRLPAVVRWSTQAGFGLQFLQLGARETYAVSALVSSTPAEPALASASRR